MNINKFLQLLTEGREISEINKKIEGKVPDSVISALSSKMKGRNYDNIAMAIFDAIQTWEESDNKAFLIKRPKLVYAALKEAARGNSSFNPKEELERIEGYGGDPMRIWSIYRSEDKENKEKRKNDSKIVFGLKQARTKELPESYLFFPRNFKIDNSLGLEENDLDKQYQDIRALSQQMADRDTSGEEGAKDNHWCVASSEDRWFKSRTYKGGKKGGFFIIIVNKNKDGSPNWNDRYLLWAYPWRDEDDSMEVTTEFADKFNKHLDLDALPASTKNFIEKSVFGKIKRELPKGEDMMIKLNDRAWEAYKNENSEMIKSGWRKKVNTDSPIFKNYIKILRFLRAKYQEQRPADDAIRSTSKAFKKFVDSGMPEKRTEFSIGDYNYMFNYQSGLKKYEFVVARQDSGRKNVQHFLTEKEVRDIANNFNSLKQTNSYLYERIAGLQADFKSKAYGIIDNTPSKKAMDVLLNNKVAIAKYVGISQAFRDEVREFFIGPYFYVESSSDGTNKVNFLSSPWNEDSKQLIGDLADKDIVEKVKKVYATRVENVAEGQEKA